MHSQNCGIPHLGFRKGSQDIRILKLAWQKLLNSTWIRKESFSQDSVILGSLRRVASNHVPDELKTNDFVIESLGLPQLLTSAHSSDHNGHKCMRIKDININIST